MAKKKSLLGRIVDSIRKLFGKKKAKKKNSDSFSALESNNKSFDLVDAYNKKAQPTIITEEDTHTIIIEQ